MPKRWKCEKNDADWFSIEDDFVVPNEYTLLVTVSEGEEMAQAVLGIESLIELRDHLNEILRGICGY